MKLKFMALLFILSIIAIVLYSRTSSNVEIVAPSQMSVSVSVREKDAFETQQLKTQGYILSKTDNAKYLLNVKNVASEEIKQYQNDKNPYDTHLKKNISQINLAFPYNGISGIEQENIIGFAATGTYIRAGWTGVKEVFEDKTLGVCSLNIENLKLVNMKIKINADRLTYAVNNKPTTMQVEGNPQSGFRYSVFWTSNKYDYNMDCSAKVYNKTLLQKMVAYADLIDKKEI